MATDITAILPSIQAPTLALSHETIPPTAAVVAEVANLIPGATLRELRWPAPPTGLDDFWLPILDEVEEFLTGERRGDGDHRRFVTTLLFTDIAGSTEHAARHGDAPGGSCSPATTSTCATSVDDHGGRLIKNIGDGSLSSFDGPVGAIRCARALAEAIRPLGLEIRAGVPHGRVRERIGLDVAGLAVHVGARVEAAAESRTGPGHARRRRAVLRLGPGVRLPRAAPAQGRARRVGAAGRCVTGRPRRRRPSRPTGCG